MGRRERMKKSIYVLAIALLTFLLSTSLVYAALDIDVTVGQAVINPLETQQITATTNQKGVGILLVIQPAAGTPWLDYINSHPTSWISIVWHSLPSSIQTEISDAIGGKIVSFVVPVTITESGGGSRTYNFPSDFTGINGEPSTAAGGTYKVIFAFVSASGPCFKFEKDFACNSWFVIPESPFGTAMALTSPLIVCAAAALYRKRPRKA